MAERTESILAIEATPDRRAGVHADTVTALTKGSFTQLDFILIDTMPGDDGNLAGVLSSRVFLSNEDVLKLRDMLNKHTAEWAQPEESE